VEASVSGGTQRHDLLCHFSISRLDGQLTGGLSWRVDGLLVEWLKESCESPDIDPDIAARVELDRLLGDW